MMQGHMNVKNQWFLTWGPRNTKRSFDKFQGSMNLDGGKNQNLISLT